MTFNVHGFKKKFFALKKQSVPISINDFAKMQSFVDENVFFFFFFCILHINSRWTPKMAGKRF